MGADGDGSEGDDKQRLALLFLAGGSVHYCRHYKVACADLLRTFAWQLRPRHRAAHCTARTVFPGIRMRPAGPTLIEPRWPVAFAVIASTLLLGMLPARIRYFPSELSWVLGLLVALPIVGVGLKRSRTSYWLRVERTVILVLFVIAAAAMVVNLTHVVTAMVERPADVNGIQLLSSSIGVWTTNVIIFALLYWQIDRGGPERRLNFPGAMPDWLFPQESAPREDVSPDWHPTFIDYLYLAYSTATAFSTTDAMPLTARAKLLMMLESSFSLMTVLVVASRAINILGG